MNNCDCRCQETIFLLLGSGVSSPLLQNYENEQRFLIQNENKSFTTCSKKDLPTSEDAQIIKLEKKALPNIGAGRLLVLEKTITLFQALDLTKKHLKLPHVRLAMANSASMGN